ncbi:WASH complex subunit 4-like isoform X2 [Phoenix dactylifera]|uniref:WASH complex subunit 4-like isoform X2 n=1 Tax=Phoenix dactylifera TaxID=42345 RepID=A0A8B8J5K0_PHODC|nr:WASH complex subunit 4-like isoform X2 [Phoenix dactylifera]
MASQLLEQQEKLRRLVDEWRFRSHDLLSNLRGDPLGCPSPSATPPSSSSSHPVRLHVEPLEHSDLSTLLESDNVAVSKLVMVLSYDCIEISRLHRSASKKLYRQLLLFGHRSSPQEVLLEGEPQKAFGESLSLFMELYETTSRMTAVLGNLVKQLNSIYSLHDKNILRPLNSVKNFMLRTAFEALGDGLAMFTVLDEILKQNSHIKSHLSLFARMLNKVKLEVDIFGITAVDFDFLDQVVSQLQKLLEVGLFQRLLQSESPLHATLEQVRCNKKFIDVCSSCIHDGLSEILPRLDTWKEFPLDRRKILQYVALFIFFTYASAEVPEKKVVKLLLEMLKLVPLTYVEGGRRIILLDVLKSQCHPSYFSWPSIREVYKESVVMKRNYLTQLSEKHSRDWQAIKDALFSWITSFQSTVYPSSEMLSEAWIRFHIKQIMQGILLANRLHMLVISMLDLHELLEVPIRREKLKSLCHMIISLKVLENTFQIKGAGIARSLPHIINIIQADIEKFILPAKSKLQLEVVKVSQTSKLGFLSSLTRGGKETDTRLTDSLSLGYLDIDFLRIRKFIRRLGTVTDFQNIVEEVTNCSFLYWRKEMMGNWLSMVYMDVSRFLWLQYILDAFSDGLWLLKLGRVGKATLQSYEKEIEDHLKNEIVAPLCRDIETDLRLHVHSTHLKGSVLVNPKKTGVRNLSWYLQMKPLQLPFKFIDIRLLMENYLNSAFYNHSAMSTYDWKIYSEMRLLAELKYGLALDDIHLAENSMDQDFDLNEIVQNLHSFTENYSYNIIKQIFIERVPNGQCRKNLRVISVDRVAASIALHGLRPISTASISVLKFLTEMFTTLSELLQDKLVQSDLLKESNFWKSDKGTITHPSLQQGELRFFLGKLAFGDRGQSFLEQLQSIISKVGNALGLMRILLAGSCRYSCNNSRFISRARYDMRFAESCMNLGFVEESVTAGKIMDTAIEKYQSNVKIESFSFLINMFLKELQCSRYDHLKDFFAVVPSLIANMIDSKVHCMDKLLRRDHESGNMFCLYDSCIMGVAFILKVMGQEKSFDELNWFASAKKNLEGVSPSEDHSSSSEQRRGSSLVAWMLWGQAPSASTEVQKRAVDKRRRCRKEVELIECGLKVARTIMS